MSLEQPTTQPPMNAEIATEEACVAAGGEWNGATQLCTMPHTEELKTDADLQREVEMLRARLQVREKQLSDAIGTANKANTKFQAEAKAQKEMLVNSIQMDSNFSKDELEKKNLSELQIIRLTIDKSQVKAFASVAAELDAANRKKKPFLTAGAWDSQKKQWVGGT